MGVGVGCVPVAVPVAVSVSGPDGVWFAVVVAAAAFDWLTECYQARVRLCSHFGILRAKVATREQFAVSSGPGGE